MAKMTRCADCRILMKNLADHKIIVTYAGQDSIWAAFAIVDDAEEFAFKLAQENQRWGVRVEYNKASARGTVVIR